MSVKVLGIRCEDGFEAVVNHFISLGGDSVLMEPLYIYGEKHALSAYYHGERAFAEGTNRSKNILTETIMYAAGERQISKALKKMKPTGNEMVAIVIGCPEDLRLEDAGINVDEKIVEGTPEKAKAMGLDTKGMSISSEELALELVAMLDIQK